MPNLEGKLRYGDVRPRSGAMSLWERSRRRNVHWLMESFAEALGVFLYVYCGVGSTAGYILGNLLELPGVSSLLQIGLAYALGIVFALVICAPTSGGHFNPAMTIAAAVFRGFPWKKVPRYITAQILGGYIGCLLVYVQYREQIMLVEDALLAKGTLDTINFTSAGPAGIFGLYPASPYNLGYVFLNEVMADFVIAITIWSCLDPSNFLAPPAAMPWIIALAYAVCIWGYAPVGIAANTARDVGGRLMVLTIWGTKAAGGRYAAIAALTNIPVTLFAGLVYEFLLSDSNKVIPDVNREFLECHMAHNVVDSGDVGGKSPSSVQVDEKMVSSLEV
ncbi:aquaporin-like protein [Neolentinus lepideus HHB14362 ss-1]|uniref:Aquaporin-like protein n=1 Tax=Neolentinus lepideus HHB14362 ss-1 TaxID=1314782 RepID=A0A165NVI6_9AGAM|nr:aquaporin-like protein [Neolentinus lepideus HHB14362 ss-1]